MFTSFAVTTTSLTKLPPSSCSLHSLKDWQQGETASLALFKGSKNSLLAPLKLCTDFMLS